MSRESSRPGLEITSLSAIEHVLAHRPERIRRIHFHAGKQSAKGRIHALLERARAMKIATDSVPHAPAAGEGVTATLAPFEYSELKPFLKSLEDEKNGLVVALDHLQDPQNFGALCRTAEAFNVQGILLPKDRSVTVGPGVYHASVGAVDTLPIVLVNNLSDALRKLKEAGYWIVGTSLGGGAKTLSETPSFEKVGLVLGAEHEGLSPMIAKACDWLVEIPLSGRVQSLNVSVAGALFMYEWAKRLGRVPT